MTAPDERPQWGPTRSMTTLEWCITTFVCTALLIGLLAFFGGMVYQARSDACQIARSSIFLRVTPEMGCS